MNLEMQGAVCANMYAVVDNGEIISYICRLSGEKPACHLSINDVGFVDRDDCVNRI